MSNVKISALPAATTPLTGTELVPLVQSGVTSQVAVSNIKTTPAGSNTQVQFNNSSAFGASASLTWDGTTLAATKFSGALNGTVGATTPSTGAFTTLSATGNITCNGGKYSLQSASTEYGSLSTASGDLTLASAAGGYLKLLSVGNLLLGYAASAEIFRGSSVGVSLTNSLGVGGATPSGGGGGAGITFPATQSASTDANTLDDYEEGTWTPITLGGSVAGTGTYSQQLGTYTKVGRVVHIQATVTYSAHTGSGLFKIGGFPFTASSAAESGAGSFGQVSNLTMSALCIPFLLLQGGQTFAYLEGTPAGGGTSSIESLDTACGLVYSATYFI